LLRRSKKRAALQHRLAGLPAGRLAKVDRSITAQRDYDRDGKTELQQNPCRIGGQATPQYLAFAPGAREPDRVAQSS
jgi:hypothetical protein